MGMGFEPIVRAPKSAKIKLSIERVNIDRGGYDDEGRYFGHGEPLFRVHDDEGLVDFRMRYSSRVDLRLSILGRAPIPHSCRRFVYPFAVIKEYIDDWK